MSDIESKYKNLISQYKEGITIPLLKNKEEFLNYTKIRYDWIELYYSTFINPILDRDDYHFLKTVNYTLSNFFFHKDIIKLIKEYEEKHKCNLC